jgi:hypothetical protein
MIRDQRRHEEERYTLIQLHSEMLDSRRRLLRRTSHLLPQRREQSIEYVPDDGMVYSNLKSKDQTCDTTLPLTITKRNLIMMIMGNKNRNYRWW